MASVGQIVFAAFGSSVFGKHRVNPRTRFRVYVCAYVCVYVCLPLLLLIIGMFDCLL